MKRIAIAQRVTRTFAAAAIATGLVAAPAWSQTYPSRPIRLIVNFPPGGTGDILGRIIGNQLAIELNQSVVVENRSGAGGTIGARDVVNAAPDGYTLTVGQTPEIVINPYFMKDVGYDPLKDLQPIALAGVVPLALVVPAKSPYSTVAEWVAGLRSGQPLTFASAGIGTPGHLGGELLKLKLDSKLVHAQRRRSGPERRGRRPGRFLFSRLSGRGAADAERPGQALGGIDGEAFAAGARRADSRRGDGARRFRFRTVGRLFRAAGLAEGHRDAAQCSDQQDHSRARHQGAPRAKRRRSVGAFDRSVQ